MALQLRILGAALHAGLAAAPICATVVAPEEGWLLMMPWALATHPIMDDNYSSTLLAKIWFSGVATLPLEHVPKHFSVIHWVR